MPLSVLKIEFRDLQSFSSNVCYRYIEKKNNLKLHYLFEIENYHSAKQFSIKIEIEIYFEAKLDAYIEELDHIHT